MIAELLHDELAGVSARVDNLPLYTSTSTDGEYVLVRRGTALELDASDDRRMEWAAVRVPRGTAVWSGDFPMRALPVPTGVVYARRKDLNVATSSGGGWLVALLATIGIMAANKSS